MTTTVIIKAHCASTMQVAVIVTHSEINKVLEQAFLQDGEELQLCAYGYRKISIQEVEKK